MAYAFDVYSALIEVDPMKYSIALIRFVFAVVILIFALAVLSVPVSAQAQKTGKIPRIGSVSFSPRSDSPGFRDALLQGLQEHGYIMGETLLIERRSADGKRERIGQLMAELVNLPVDLILAPGMMHALAARKATRTIPIVTMFVADPVENGLATSLAHPGGNVTGMAWLFRDLGAKQLELLQKIVPELSRVAVLWNAGNPSQNVARVRAMERLAQSASIHLISLEVESSEEFDGAFTKMLSESVEALLVVGDPFMYRHRTRIADFAIEHRLPSAFSIRPFAEAGGLLSYAPDIKDSYRRAATYVDKILKGAKPADLPMQRPTKFELIINLKTAKAIGVTIPPIVLIQATDTIQ